LRALSKFRALTKEEVKIARKKGKDKIIQKLKEYSLRPKAFYSLIYYKIFSADLNQMTSATVAKIDSLKKWTINTYKNTRQSVYEHMGKACTTLIMNNILIINQI
jgi:hypothetical protein